MAIPALTSTFKLEHLFVSVIEVGFVTQVLRIIDIDAECGYAGGSVLKTGICFPAVTTE